jgi:iron complex transport system substrate-binding protein
VRWARFFRFEESGDSTALVVGNQVLDVPEERYALEEGGDRSSTGQDPPGPRRIVILASSHAPAFEALEALDRVVAVSRGQWFYSPGIRQRLEGGDIVAVGAGETFDLEAVVALEADLVIGYPDIVPPTARRRLERDFGIPVIYWWDYLEEHPLGRAEWILAAGALLGSRAAAEELFTEIESDYLRIKAAAAGSGPPEGARDGAGPRVLLNAPSGDVWPVPRSRSHSSVFVKDAGGVPVLQPEGIGASLLDPEVVLQEAADAEFWLNPGGARTLTGLREAVRFAPAFASFQNGEVYGPVARISSAGAWDFFESGYLYANRVLRDLALILGPGVPADDELFYYRRLE